MAVMYLRSMFTISTLVREYFCLWEEIRVGLSAMLNSAKIRGLESIIFFKEKNWTPVTDSSFAAGPENAKIFH